MTVKQERVKMPSISIVGNELRTVFIWALTVQWKCKPERIGWQKTNLSLPSPQLLYKNIFFLSPS